MLKLLGVFTLLFCFTHSIQAKECDERITALEQSVLELEETLNRVQRELEATRRLLDEIRGEDDSTTVVIMPLGNGTNGNIRTWNEMINSVAANQFKAASSENQIAKWTKYSNVTDLLNYTPDNDFSFDWCWGSDCFDDSNHASRRIGAKEEGHPIYRSHAMAFDSELGDTLEELRENLVARMRSGYNVKKCVNMGWSGYQCGPENDFYVGGMFSTRWYFEYENRAYVIDTNLPLAANPVSILKKDTNEGFTLQ